MKQTVIGYLYSGKIHKNTEIFLNITKEVGLDVILFDISKEVTDTLLDDIFKCDVFFNDSGEDFAIEYTRFLESLGKPVLESSLAMMQENKWKFNLIAKKNNIPTPKTILLSTNLDQAKEQLIEFGSWPLILKRIEGTWGEYVAKAENIESALKTIQDFWTKGEKKIPVLAQEFIDSFSYRVTYIDNEIVQTAIKENNNWKCTGVYATRFKKFDIDPQLDEIVKKIISSFDIKVCGIDLLKKGTEWLVIEVNTEPGLDFFEEEMIPLFRKIVLLLIKIAKSKDPKFHNLDSMFEKKPSKPENSLTSQIVLEVKS